MSAFGNSVQERRWWNDWNGPALVWLIVLLGLGMRAFHYGRDPAMWHDEAALVVNVLEKDYGEMLGPLLFWEAAPPGFLWLERFIYGLLGDSTYALRLVPFLASCAGLMLMVPLGRRLLSPAAVPWALLLVACSDRLLWHACEAKPYALDVLAAVGLAWLFCVTRRWGLAARLLIFTVLAPVTIFLVYPGCFLCGGLLVALLPEMIERSRRSMQVHWPWCGYAALALVVFASFVLLLGPVRAQRCAAMDSCWLAEFPDLGRPWTWPYWAIRETVCVVDFSTRPLGGVLTPWFLLGAVWMWRRGQRAEVMLLGIPILVAMGAALMHSYPYTGARVMVYALPAIVLFIAEAVPPTLEWLAAIQGDGLWVRWSGRAGWLALVVVLLAPLQLSAGRLVQVWDRPDNDLASDFVLRNHEPTDLVVSQAWQDRYYFRSLGSAFQMSPASIEAHPDSRVWMLLTDRVCEEDRYLALARALPARRAILLYRHYKFVTLVLADRANDY